MLSVWLLRKGKRGSGSHGPSLLTGTAQLERGTDTNKITITRKPIAKPSQLQKSSGKANAEEISLNRGESTVELSPTSEKRAEELSSDFDKESLSTGFQAELNSRNDLGTVYELEVNQPRNHL